MAVLSRARRNVPLQMWHVLHTVGHAEPQVCKFLAMHGLETFAPQFPPPLRTRAGSIRAQRHRWVFPGYVFFRVPREFTAWERIRWMPGARSILHTDGVPAVVGEDLIDHLRARLATMGGALRTARFRRGQPVVIEGGPLRMVDAIFERNLDAPARVEILVQMLGRAVTVEVDSAILRAAG